jgi:hypothetical protein
VFENRVLRRIFGPKRDEMMGGWRKLYGKELRNMYSSSSIIIMDKIKEDEMDRACSTNGDYVGTIARRKENIIYMGG